ncbi:MAG: hypothetical protein KJO06_12320 [Gemmatimonadetes bacterium]|nr:hypothetical protein [Gemmatimonadota bacterium]
MKHLRWSTAGLFIIALAACDSTPVDPGATGAGPDGTLSVAAPVLGAVPALDDASGHLYDAVAVAEGINWTDARTAAEGLSAGSCLAYLASITSAEENDFILANFQGGVPSIGGTGYWIGGFQDTESGTPANGWMWVSGDPWGYTDWATAKPDGFLTVDAVRYTGTTGGLSTTVQWEDVDLTLTAPGYVVEFEGDCTEDALIDVMLKLTQGEGPRNINLKSRGKIAAAVLSVADVFDATTIDPKTVTLGDGSDPDAPVAGNKHGKLMVAWPDLDEDGLADALFHFNTQDLIAAGLTAETTELVLRGMTTDGVEFTGVDEVAVK